MLLPPPQQHFVGFEALKVISLAWILPNDTAAYLLSHNIENVTNSVCFEMPMQFNPLHFSVTLHTKHEINPYTVWPNFKFFENVVIWETILQEIIFFISCKYFDILTFCYQGK